MENQEGTSITPEQEIVNLKAKLWDVNQSAGQLDQTLNKVVQTLLNALGLKEVENLDALMGKVVEALQEAPAND